MIQLVEDIEYLEYGKVPLNYKCKRIFIEIASNRKIDIAIINSAELKEFDESDTGDDVDIDWVENRRNYDFEYEFLSQEKKYLIFWNANEDDDAIVAYKITPLE